MCATVVQSVETAPPAPSYWSLSRGPLASLAFIVPLLIVYEVGVLSLGSQAIRNGADLWLRGLLDTLGFGQYFLLPTLTVVLLLSWHHLSGQPWRLPLRVAPGMALESLAFALGLVLIAQLQGAACQALGIPIREIPAKNAAAPAAAHVGARSEAPPQLSVSETPVATRCARVTAFLGAGIYEEVLFRLVLLPCCVFALARCGVSRARGLLAAVIITSIVFSLAHYVGPHGDRWQSFSFLFRAVAGSFFALLFVYRGFGIAAGAHAGYDILVGLA